MPTWKDARGRRHASASLGGRRLHRVLPPGATAGDARALEAELLRALRQTAPARTPSVPGDPLLSSLLADYCDRHAQTLRSPSTARHHAMRIGRWCEGRRASEAAAVAERFRSDCAGAYAGATINRSLGALRQALNSAWRRGELAEDWAARITWARPAPPRTTWLDLTTVQRLAAHASPPARAAIWIAVLTGMRRGEVLALRPHMIGVDSITLPAGATKTLRTRTVPIIAPLRPWLAHIGPDGLGITFEGLKSALRRARVAAKMPEVQFRDLRRSCATLLVQHGVPLQVVSRILGHSGTQVTERVYAHLAVDQLRAGLQVLADLHQASAPALPGGTADAA